MSSNMSTQHTFVPPEGDKLSAIGDILNNMSPLVPPFLLGVLTHATFLRVHEVEQFMYTLIFSSLALFASVLLGYISLGGLTVLAAARETVGLTAVFAAGLYGSMLVYRAWLHPLRGFKGPFGARLTRFWSVRQAARDVQYYKVVDGLHKTYGDVFRTGPRELCIVRSAAVPLIYGPKSKCHKSTWYAQVDVKNKEGSVHMTRDFESHRMRRRAWDQGFSMKALNTYIPRITDKVDTFLSQITKLSAAAPGTGIDATSWTMLLTFDIMGKVGFSKDFQGLETGVEHPAIKCIHDHMTVLGVVSHTPWLLNMIPRIPGAGAGFAPFFKWCKSEVQAKKKSLDLDAYPQDIVSWLMKAFLEKSPTAAPTEAALDDDSRAVIIAGSDTTATTLAWILYFFCKNPHVLAKLHAQVDAIMPAPGGGGGGGGGGDGGRSAWSYEKAKQISYIDDIINEALRIKPALLTGGYRETPAQGLQVEEVFIPGGINVFVPLRQIQNDERYWTQPDEFIPERWSERRKEMGTEGAPWLPFNMGAYACPGKALAMMTMRIVLSRFAQECTVNFAPGEDGVKFEAGAMDTFTTTLLPLQLEFHKRH